MPTRHKAKEDFEKLATLKKQAEQRVTGESTEPYPCSTQEIESFVAKAKQSMQTLQTLSGLS